MQSQKFHPLRFWLHLKPWKKILTALVLGIITGLIFKEKTESVKFLGDIFISGILLIVGPIVFISLIRGVISMNDPIKMGRIGGVTMALYIVTMAIATLIGIVLAMLAKVGSDFQVLTLPEIDIPPSPSFMEILLTLIPNNPVSPFLERNVLQIIVLALLVGLAINFSGKHADPATKVIHATGEIAYKMVNIVMSLAPYGVFGLMAWITGHTGLSGLKSLFTLVAVIYAGCILHTLLVYSGMLKFIARLDPRPFFRGFFEAQIVAFTTGSSLATLPISLQCAQRNLGVPEEISSFVQPLGATVNMNGLSVYLGAIAVFAANVYGIELTLMQLVIIIGISTLASIGCAGVPGSALIVMSLVLAAIGLPLEIIAVIAAVDRIIEMATTTVNVTGDAVVAVVVSKMEKELSEETYNAPASV